MSFLDLHDRAMAIVDEARQAERNGDRKEFIELLRTACNLEQQAARSLEPLPESEPTRTVLFRSASSLAFQAEDYQQACTLAFDGLTGNSPEEHAAELLEIVAEAKFRLHLIAQNFQVPTSEITLTVRGPHVSVGMAPAKQTTQILQRVEKLLRERVETLFKSKIDADRKEYPLGSAKLFDVFIRQLAADEFAVAFRLGLHQQLFVRHSLNGRPADWGFYERSSGCNRCGPCKIESRQVLCGGSQVGAGRQRSDVHRDHGNRFGHTHFGANPAEKGPWQCG